MLFNLKDFYIILASELFAKITIISEVLHEGIRFQIILILHVQLYFVRASTIESSQLTIRH
jgi:uncharacterized protein YueI